MLGPVPAAIGNHPPASAPDPDAAREVPFADYMIDPRTGVSNLRADALRDLNDRERAWRRNRIG